MLFLISQVGMKGRKMNKEAKKILPRLVLIYAGFMHPVPSKYLKLWFFLQGLSGFLEGNLLVFLEYSFHDVSDSLLFPGNYACRSHLLLSSSGYTRLSS